MAIFWNRPLSIFSQGKMKELLSPSPRALRRAGFTSTRPAPPPRTPAASEFTLTPARRSFELRPFALRVRSSRLNCRDADLRHHGSDLNPRSSDLRRRDAGLNRDSSDLDLHFSSGVYSVATRSRRFSTSFLRLISGAALIAPANSQILAPTPSPLSPAPSFCPCPAPSAAPLSPGMASPYPPSHPAPRRIRRNHCAFNCETVSSNSELGASPCHAF